MKQLLLTLFLLLSITTAWALSPEQMRKLQPHDRLQWQDAQHQTLVMQISAINTFVDADGSNWYWVHGKLADGSGIACLLDPSGQGDADIITAAHPLHGTGVRRKDIWRIDQEGKGSLIYNGIPYDYQAEDSDDADYIESPGAPADSISYYSFASQQNDDIGFTIIEWDDDDFQMLETQFLDPAGITLLPAQ